MANWDFVIAYTPEAADWLTEQGLPRPDCAPGNRLPTTAEMQSALAAEGNLKLDYPAGEDDLYVFEEGVEGFALVISGFDWSQPESVPKDSFQVRWLCALELRLLLRLCEGGCGQLWLYSDSGAPLIVLQPGMEASAVLAAWEAAREAENTNRALGQRLYAGT
jgi:hypothetical protein